MLMEMKSQIHKTIEYLLGNLKLCFQILKLKSKVTYFVVVVQRDVNQNV